MTNCYPKTTFISPGRTTSGTPRRSASALLSRLCRSCNWGTAAGSSSDGGGEADGDEGALEDVPGNGVDVERVVEADEGQEVQRCVEEGE